MSEANKQLVRRHFEEIFQLMEHWATREDLPMLLQLGIIQPPGGRPK